jgi:hypothetical protein
VSRRPPTSRGPRKSPAQTPPAVVIRLEFERGPVVYNDTLGDWEASRLCDWITAHPDLVELLERAIVASMAWQGRDAA